MGVNIVDIMFIKYFCYHCIVEKLRGVFTIIGVWSMDMHQQNPSFKLCYQIKTNTFIIIVAYSFIQHQ